MSTTDFASTIPYNIFYSPQQNKPSYDNDIIGVEYERDLYQPVRNLRLRFEIGLADRFGHYLLCCEAPIYRDATERSTNRVHTAELWSGGKIRWENIELGSTVRLAVAATLGLSAISRAIGRERQRELDDQGNAHLLFYVAPEMSLSLTSYPNWELVIRVPHRSGADGTLGRMQEGYNANVVGLRYIF